MGDDQAVAYLRPIAEPENATVDIVAVHGLNPFNGNNHAEATWTHPESNKLWLRDFLPNQLPKARIFLFSYNSNPAFEAGADGVYKQANNLLVKLRVERLEAPDRPLVFICHSLGGLVVKRAVVQAQQTPSMYGQLSNSIYGLVFFATPHNGGNWSTLGAIAAGIATFVLRTPTNDYLDAVKGNSFFAEAMRYDFRNRQNDFSILSFYETKSSGMTGKIVDEKSAVFGLGDAQETMLGLEGDHSSICRFKSQDGDDYRPVWKHIKYLSDMAVKNAQERLQLQQLGVPHVPAGGVLAGAPPQEHEESDGSLQGGF